MCKAADAGDLVEVKIVVKMNTNEYRFDSYFPLLAIGEAGYAEVEEWRSNPTKTEFTAKVMMPKAKFDFIGSFMHVNLEYDKGYDHLAWYIKEGVEITDSTVVEIVPAQSVNCIRFDTYNPDGAPTVHKSYKYINEDYKTEIVNEGNVSMITLINTLFNKDYGMINYLCRNGDVCEPSEAVPYRRDGVRYMDVYVNNVSDRYEFRQARLMNANNGEIYAVAQHFFGSPQGNKVVSNKVSDYFEINNRFAPSWVDNADSARYEKKYTVFFASTETNGRVGTDAEIGHVRRGDTFTKAYACTGTGAGDTPMAVLSFERVVTDVNTDDEYVDRTPWLFLLDGTNSRYGAFESSVYATGEDGKKPVQYYPGHPGLTYTLSEMPGALVCTAPVIFMSYTEDWNKRNSRDLMLFDYSLRSQALDARGSDRTKAKVSLRYKGQDVLNGEDLAWEWPYTWVAQAHDPGEYVLAIEDSAYTIDGMKTMTAAEMRFNNSRADYFAPTLQGFQVRNTDGKFASMLEKPSNGELRIVGGDFNMKKSEPYPDGYYDLWYTQDTVFVKVEYALHGTDNYKTLQNVIQQETYPGFGKYWKAPLSHMTDVVENSWYDVRVTLKDAGGNSHTQTFSPAFHIMKSDGVAYNEKDDATIYFTNDMLTISGMENPAVSVYSANGQLVYSGNGDMISLASLGTGVYIVRATGAATSKVVKIVKR